MFCTLVTDGKVSAIAAANERAQALGVGANVLLQAALPALGGRGGGKADMAQGGGTNPDGIADAVTAIQSAISARVAG
jgi:alanyl-tRNA synthetase